jgi:predicted RNase H-like HicB family nuclease
MTRICIVMHLCPACYRRLWLLSAMATSDTPPGTVWLMSGKLKMTVAYHNRDEEGWIVARVLGVPGAISQGRTREEARENVIDALRLILGPDDDDVRVAAGRS